MRILIVDDDLDRLERLTAAIARGDPSAAVERAPARDTAVLGPTTNLAFLQDVLAHPAFLAGETHTGFLPEHLPDWHPAETDAVAAAIVAGLTGSPAAAPATDGAVPMTPTPWQTLGGWRLGR